MNNAPHLPDLATAKQLAEGKKLVPVYRRLLSDSLTPVGAFQLLDHGT
jgi:anthranilate synthase component 1